MNNKMQNFILFLNDSVKLWNDKSKSVERELTTTYLAKNGTTDLSGFLFSHVFILLHLFK